MSEEKKQCDSKSCDKKSCEGCSHAKEGGIPKEQLNAYSDVKKVIGVVSGKGGVGKSFVTASLANEMAARGYRVGILDADITGPSIPRMYGLKGAAQADDNGIYPMLTENDIKIMSINLLLPQEETPVIWRGPILANMVKQFWTDVIWGELDYLFVDMPPGTGDVPLTVFQSLPVDGVVIVTSPQDLVRMIVKKAYNMAEMMKIPVAGLVEVPCVKRNVGGAVNALAAADMALAGIASHIPVDQVIDAMGEVGMKMDVSLRETSMGGVATSPKGLEIAERLGI